MDAFNVGSVMLSEDEPELQAPEIKVQPNTVMVTIAAVILIIGSILTSYNAFSNLFSDEPSDEELQMMIDGFEGTNIDVNISDMRQWSDALYDSNYFTVIGIMEIIVTLCFGTGVFLLIRRNRLGVYIGGGGAGLYTAVGLWGSWVMFGASSHLPSILSTTFGLTGVIMSFCSLTCMGIVFMPLMFKSGRAALPVKLAIIDEEK